MTKTIDLPAPIFSKLKKVHLNLMMTGKHFSLLAAYNGGSPEQIILSILKDLMDEDESLLTREEALYLFTLVKINTIGPKITLSIQCPHCGEQNQIEGDLSSCDFNVVPSNYKIPEIKFKIEDENEVLCQIIPPSLSTEMSLVDWYQTQKNITRDKIIEDKNTMIEFTMYKNMLYLVDKATHLPLIQTISDFDRFENLLSCNSYQTIGVLYGHIKDELSFGMKTKIQESVCKNKECGGVIRYHIPLLYGLYNKSGNVE